MELMRRRATSVSSRMRRSNIFKFDARGKIATPSAEVDAAEYDLFVAGGGEAAEFRRSTSAGGMLRLLPRTNGMTQ